MKPIMFLIVIVAAIQLGGCGGGPSQDLATLPDIDPGIRQTDLSSFEGVWNYNMYAVSIMEFNDGMQVAQDELNYAFTITPDSVYDPYYQADLTWSFENGELVLSHEDKITVDEYYGFTDIDVDTQVKYTINFNADNTEMEITGTAISTATFTSPGSGPDTIKCTTSYSGTAVRE
jgi:hypothetical protein